MQATLARPNVHMNNRISDTSGSTEPCTLKRNVMDRRRKLLLATTALATTGAAALAYLLASSLSPPKYLDRLYTLTVDLNEIPPGSYQNREWLGKPIVIYRPASAQREKFFAYIAASTYRGCALWDAKRIGMKREGLLDPCHMGFWSYEGRFVAGANTPEGVLLPDLERLEHYRWRSDSVVEFLP